MRGLLLRLRLSLLIFFLGAATLMVNFHSSHAQSKAITNESLKAGFINPPNEAKPRVWWHWMNGNITQDGIRKDLEWMKRAGIGGFQNFDVGINTPQVVDNRLVYMTDEWKKAFEFTAELADSLDLEMATAASPGWSETGGPWVKPEEAMKKYVWSEIRVEGGEPFSGALPEPPTETGSFQNVRSAGRGFRFDPNEERPEYYSDAKVIAYRVPENDFSMTELDPEITSSGGTFNLEDLSDGDVVTSSLLPPAPNEESSWVQFEFDEPQTIQGITIASTGDPFDKVLEVSNDGESFSKVTDINDGRVPQNTITFEPVTGKFFRLRIQTPHKDDMPMQRGGMFSFGGGNEPIKPAGRDIAELVLHTGAYVNDYESKAGFVAVPSVELNNSPTPQVSNAISPNDVVDLTSEMQPDGTLNWTPPAGRWDIIRMGYTLTGQRNKPAADEATGLEVDKLNPEHVESYFTYYLDQYEDASGGLIGQHGLQYLITDSWEAGPANWTDNMIAEFEARRGYDMEPWLPILTGRVVESAKSSDRFLWDFIRTLEEMVAEYHYDQLTELLDERNMKGRYSESHEGGRAMIGDGMEVKRTAAVPMSATWTPGGYGGPGPGVGTRFKADVRESASVSHIYGQDNVAAESLTAMFTDWAWSPELLKTVADMELASGLNRFVIHTSVHQPVDREPGLSLGPFGQWFTRHETWSEQAIAWTTYLARSSYMLMQGDFVADVAYLYGEGSNITALFGNELPPVPEGYEYDFVNADALINVLEAQNGDITSPAGASYRILALDSSTARITVPVLRKIKNLVENGAVVTGKKPVETPSLSDDPEEFDELVNELWADENSVKNIGNGKVYSGYSIQQVLDMENIGPDFTYTKPEDDTEVLYVHHAMEDSDFYWVNNRNERVEELDATFRVEGKSAEIWHPETGRIEEVSYHIEDGVTTVPLRLEPDDAVFVVFRDDTEQMSRTIPEKQEEVVFTADGPWTVQFQEGRGAPSEITFDTLTPWNESENSGVKYFSGTGTYTKTMNASSEWFQNDAEFWLELGEVKNLAEVIVNGESLGIVWKEPFRVDVTEALQEGENTVQIKVTNLWVNRLIGDRQPDVEETYTFTVTEPYEADTPLKTSGLIGPVRLISLTQE